MNFSIYKVATGEISHFVSCSQVELPFQLLRDEAAVEGQYDPSLYRVVDGVAVLKDLP